MTAKQFALVALAAASMALNANALMLTPLSATWQGSIPNNPDADDVENITGTSAELTTVYKDNVGGSESGSFAGSYQTTYANTPLDPQDATITYTGGSAITGTPIYLLVKDGNHDPIWYIFDISGWNGTETIELMGFWPDGGAISHVSILSPGGGTTVPDGGSTLMLLGAAVTSLGLLRRRLGLV